MGIDKLFDWIFSLVGIEYNSSYEQIGETLQEAKISINNEKGYFPILLFHQSYIII